MWMSSAGASPCPHEPEHSAVTANEQGIAELLAHPVQGAADAGL